MASIRYAKQHFKGPKPTKRWLAKTLGKDSKLSTGHSYARLGGGVTSYDINLRVDAGPERSFSETWSLEMSPAEAKQVVTHLAQELGLKLGERQ